MFKLALVNGLPRMESESANLPSIYQETLNVVSGAPGAGEIQTNGTDSNGDPVLTTGTAVTLPSSETYTDDELNVYLNGKKMMHLIDFNFEGSAPRTQVSFTFDLYVDDVIEFKKERNA